MKVKIISILIILVMIISGCQASVTTGTVADMTYIPAHTMIIMQTVNTGSFSTTVPITTSYPDIWYVVIEGYDENNEYHQTTYSVSEEEYNSINIGDTYTKE